METALMTSIVICKANATTVRCAGRTTIRTTGSVRRVASMVCAAHHCIHAETSYTTRQTGKMFSSEDHTHNTKPSPSPEYGHDWIHDVMSGRRVTAKLRHTACPVFTQHKSTSRMCSEHGKQETEIACEGTHDDVAALDKSAVRQTDGCITQQRYNKKSPAGGVDFNIFCLRVFTSPGCCRFSSVVLLCVRLRRRVEFGRGA
jgi:hypothetical protein